MEDSTSCVHNCFVLFVMALRCFLSHEADVGQSIMWVVFIVFGGFFWSFLTVRGDSSEFYPNDRSPWIWNRNAPGCVRPRLGFIHSAHPLCLSTAAVQSSVLWRNWRSAALWASPSRSCAGTPGSGSVPAWSVPLCRWGCLESATPRRTSPQTPHAAGEQTVHNGN